MFIFRSAHGSLGRLSRVPVRPPHLPLHVVLPGHAVFGKNRESRQSRLEENEEEDNGQGVPALQNSLI